MLRRVVPRPLSSLPEDTSPPHIGTHVDSAEEILLVLEGEAEVVSQDRRCRLGAGGMALAPAMVPHDCYNVGQGTLRLVGFFSSAAVLTRHDDVISPMG